MMTQNAAEHSHTGATDRVEYDQKGAMYFAVSVVGVYGLSIGLLIALTLK